MPSFSSVYQPRQLRGVASIFTVLNPDFTESQIPSILSEFENTGFDFKEFLITFHDNYKPFEVIPPQEFLDYRLATYAYVFEEYMSSLPKLISHFPPYIKKGINLKFNSTPSRIALVLKAFIKGQDNAIDRFSLVMYLHLLRNGLIREDGIKHEDLPKIQPFLLGNSGTGKTYLIEVFCENYDVPSIIIDTSTLTPSGYVGSNVNVIFNQLHSKYYGNYQKMSSAIIALDEFDKISIGRERITKKYHSEFQLSVQSELLKIIDKQGFDVIYNVGFGPKQERKTINTKNITFVFSGACIGLEDIISARVKRNGLGYKYLSSASLLANNRPEEVDFIEYGFIPELIGRISDYIVLKELSAEELICILKDSIASPLKEYELFFKIHGESLELDEDAILMLAEDAVRKKLGVRGLFKTMNDYLLTSMLKVSN